MAERFEIVQKTLLTLLDEKKYATLRDILVTIPTWRRNASPFCFACCPRNWRPKPLWKWTRTLRKC